MGATAEAFPAKCQATQEKPRPVAKAVQQAELVVEQRASALHSKSHEWEKAMERLDEAVDERRRAEEEFSQATAAIEAEKQGGAAAATLPVEPKGGPKGGVLDDGKMLHDGDFEFDVATLFLDLEGAEADVQDAVRRQVAGFAATWQEAAAARLGPLAKQFQEIQGSPSQGARTPGGQNEARRGGRRRPGARQPSMRRVSCLGERSKGNGAVEQVE